MELSFASSVHPQVAKRGFDGMKTSVLSPRATRKSSTRKINRYVWVWASHDACEIYSHIYLRTFVSEAFFHRLLPCLPFLLESSSVDDLLVRLIVIISQDGIKDNKPDLESRKLQLLTAIQDTQRGLVTSAHQRSSIEEALVGLESCDAGTRIKLLELDGTWRLEYTSAPDVLILLESSARLPFFQVGQIFQKFECKSQSNGGIVRNVVRWSIPNLLEDEEGATLLVSAKFSVVSGRNIYLQFEEIAVQDIDTSKLQALIAPAILPRSFLSLQILQFIKSFKAQVPVRSQGRQTVGGLYYLSYLDGNMLLGRAERGGAFVFTRTRPFA